MGERYIKAENSGVFVREDDALRMMLGLPPKPDPRDPDYSREGLFQTHNCWRCKSGTEPCVIGNPRDCENLHARND